MRHDDTWYKEKLVDYIYNNYSEYEYESEWFVNPASIQRIFHKRKGDRVVHLQR